eukprot:2302131-Amphidinium_carterae.2
MPSQETKSEIGQWSTHKRGGSAGDTTVLSCNPASRAHASDMLTNALSIPDINCAPVFRCVKPMGAEPHGGTTLHSTVPDAVL